MIRVAVQREPVILVNQTSRNDNDRPQDQELFDEYNIVNERELLSAGEQLAFYLIKRATRIMGYERGRNSVLIRHP
jgi:hypothetical protein